MLLSDWPVLTRDSSNLVSGDGLGLLGVDVFHDWESSGGPRGRFGRLGDVFCLPNVRNVHFDLPIVENVHPGAGFALPIVRFVHGSPVWTPNRLKRPRARRAPAEPGERPQVRTFRHLQNPRSKARHISGSFTGGLFNPLAAELYRDFGNGQPSRYRGTNLQIQRLLRMVERRIALETNPP